MYQVFLLKYQPKMSDVIVWVQCLCAVPVWHETPDWILLISSSSPPFLRTTSRSSSTSSSDPSSSRSSLRRNPPQTARPSSADPGRPLPGAPPLPPRPGLQKLIRKRANPPGGIGWDGEREHNMANNGQWGLHLHLEGCTEDGSGRMWESSFLDITFGEKKP